MADNSMPQASMSRALKSGSLMPGKMLIESLGVYLPPKVVSTDEILSGCKIDLRFPLERVTGIRYRHVAGDNEFSVDLARSLPEQLTELTSAFEERYLRKALRKTRGHVGKCAKISGLSRRSITDKIGSYRIDKTEFKRD